MFPQSVIFPDSSSFVFFFFWLDSHLTSPFLSCLSRASTYCDFSICIRLYCITMSKSTVSSLSFLSYILFYTLLILLICFQNSLTLNIHHSKLSGKYNNSSYGLPSNIFLNILISANQRLEPSHFSKGG